MGVCLEPGGAMRREELRGSFLSRWWTVLKLTLVMVTHIREYAKNHWMVNFKWVNCTIYKYDTIIMESNSIKLFLKYIAGVKLSVHFWSQWTEAKARTDNSPSPARYPGLATQEIESGPGSAVRFPPLNHPLWGARSQHQDQRSLFHRMQTKRGFLTTATPTARPRRLDALWKPHSGRMRLA